MFRDKNKAIPADALPADTVDTATESNSPVATENATEESAAEEATNVAPIDTALADPAPVATEVPAQANNSARFGKRKAVAVEPSFVTRVVDGVEKKWKIRGNAFHIKSVDYTAAELAQKTELIDKMIANRSGLLEEVFE